MKGIQRVVWSEGMLVSPQHLQQADLYHERLLDCRLGATASLSWGITGVEIDGGALAADQLVVNRFSGVLPDGLPLDFKAGDPEAPAARRMASRRGKVRYRKRKHIAEPPFGWIKGVLGFRRFLLRGLPNVRGEWNLVALGVNLRRMGTNWAWA